ncbi:MAG: AAA family ATPase [Phycisphaerales bacterium]|nr:MAG: AAA family ATPase [Phycisphaerales bacterium]
MKLRSMQVKNFKCVEDSTWFDICPVTCLVGKNEAGKTSLLEALHKLNPDVAELGDFDVLLEYPRRRRKQYQRRAKTEPDDALITRWELEDKDIKALEESLGRGAVPSRIVEARKGYYPGRRWAFEGGSSPEGTLPTSVQTKLERLLPKFLYFSKCNLMNGRISIDNLIKNQERGNLSGPERVFLSLLDLVGTKPRHLTSIENSEELIADLEAAAGPITEKIAKYWSQNTSLRVNFQLHPGKLQDPPPFDKGQVLQTRILNTRHNLTLNFDERSTGFVWFFSFLVWFSQVRRTFGDNLFILLDDPGIGLHAQAQEDLLRYIAMELEPHYQVLYTTHSPFMVDPNNLGRARTVEDITTKNEQGDEQYLGTKVGDKMFSTDPGTLIPLRTALGYELTRSIVTGQKTLLVESPAEAFYLNWFSKRLNEKGRAGLDPAWKIVPCGGSEKIAAFLALFGANQGSVVVLMDTTGGQTALEQFRKSELPRSCGILTVDKYGPSSDGSIEDVIGRRTYFGLVNLCYKLPRRHRLPLTGAETSDQSQRVLDSVKIHLSAHDIGAFDRHRPAEFLAENAGRCMKKLPDIEGALDRLERLFADVSACCQIRQEPATSTGLPGRPHPIADVAPVKKAGRLTETEKIS